MSSGGPNAAIDWHLTQNETYLELLHCRIQSKELLIWVQQFISILNSKFSSNLQINKLTINDYGCNVGHFTKGCNHLKFPFTYMGYDISETYLNIAIKNFQNIGEFKYLNLDSTEKILQLDDADISIMSATLEHLENHAEVVRNILIKTKKIFLLRTFIGDEYREEICNTRNSKLGYLIKQFQLSIFWEISKEQGFSMTVTRDLATDSQALFVCNGDSINRSQAVIIFER